MKYLKEWREQIELFVTIEHLYLDDIDDENCQVIDVGFGDSSVLIKTLYPQAKLLDYVEPHPDYVKELFPDGEVSGLDIMLDISQKMSFAEFSSNSKSFDLIFALDVLEHVKQPWIAATNLFSMLKVGGYLFLSVPSIGIEHHPSKFGRYGDYWRFFEGSIQNLIMDGVGDFEVVYDKMVKFNSVNLGVTTIIKRIK
jgi:SAM-dependent methyltransferase